MYLAALMIYVVSLVLDQLSADAALTWQHIWNVSST